MCVCLAVIFNQHVCLAYVFLSQVSFATSCAAWLSGSLDLWELGSPDEELNLDPNSEGAKSNHWS